MPLVSTSIPNLINGVSQQPAALRLASQAESVVNCMSSAVEGLKKRPPMNNIARLFTGSAGSTRPFIHVVDRDGTIQYLIMIRAGRQLQDSILGSSDLTKINITQEQEARAQFLEEETTKSEHNMLRGNPNHTGVFQTYIPSRALIR